MNKIQNSFYFYVFNYTNMEIYKIVFSIFLVTGIIIYITHEKIFCLQGHPNSITFLGWDKMVAIFQTTSSNAFSWMKMYEFQLRFH